MVRVYSRNQQPLHVNMIQKDPENLEKYLWIIKFGNIWRSLWRSKGSALSVSMANGWIHIHLFVSVSLTQNVLLDVRAIWLRHLSPHWSPGLIHLIWLARRVFPSSLTAPCASLPKLRARSKRTTIPNRGGPVFGQRYMSSCAPLLEPPNKLSRSKMCYKRALEGEKFWTPWNKIFSWGGM